MIRNEAARRDSSRARTTAAGPAVVVLDDEPALRRAWCALLEECGYRVWVAGDGKRGLQLIAEVKPDVVVTDIEMPLLDGREVARRLRRDAATRFIPIIAATGRAQSAKQVDLFDVVLVKPFGPEVLLAAIIDLVDREPATVVDDTP